MVNENLNNALNNEITELFLLAIDLFTDTAAILN